MRIGELAGRLGLNPRTIRFYEAVGVLPEPPRTASGYRDYDDSAEERLHFVKRAQSLGLSLDDIREILAFRDRGEAPCAYVRQAIDREAEAIDARIRDLERLRAELRRLQRLVKRLPEQRAGGGRICQIIEHDRAVSAAP